MYRARNATFRWAPPALALALALGFTAAPGPARAAHPGGHDARALAEDPSRAEGPIAPVLTGMGDNHFAVTTESAAAQRFFDQGLVLTYGFNHTEAMRAFK